MWYDPEADFRSSLAPNGTVKWEIQEAKRVNISDIRQEVSLDISFFKVDWKSLQSAYGWSALQYQAWVRGSVFIEGDLTQRMLLHADHVMEYAIDGKRVFGGDMYGFHRAPLIISLDPGSHIIDLRLIRDVRAMGGIGAPNIQVTLELHNVTEEISVVKSTVLISDVVDGQLVGQYGSITICNQGTNWIELLGFRSDVSAYPFTFSNMYLLTSNPNFHRLIPKRLL